MTRRNVFRRLLIWLPLVGLCAVVALVALPLFAFGYVDAMLHGPKTVVSVPSPDGEYEAYVEESPSIDPPNQSLWVERSDKLHVMCIADLAEDVDFIKKVMWSPDGRVVVFHSKDYLTATRVSDWLTIRVYLGREWKRSHARRFPSTFSSEGVKREVEVIEFPEPGVVSYQFKGDDTPHAIRMDFQ